MSTPSEQLPSVLQDRKRYEAAMAFSVRDAHRAVKDLFVHRMGIYWSDFLVSLAVGYAAFWAARPVGYLTLPGILLFLVSVFALYRCFAFIHEIAHFRSKPSFRTFRRVWNLLFGIPMMVPAFMYEEHREHHNKRWYGTPRDAEYLPLARLSPRHTVTVVAASFLLPFFGPIRFGLLTPVAWFSGATRRYLYRSMSTIKIDLEYHGRPPANRAERISWTAQEAACFVFVLACAALFLTGVLPVDRLAQWYALYTSIALVNSFRILGAHRYLGDEEEMSVVEQMMDTVNYPGRRPVRELWAPVGLRLHALHHLFPGLPYHAYPEAHRRLVAALPPDSAYRLTESRGLPRTLATLWRTARQHQKAGLLLTLQPRGLDRPEGAQ